MDEMGSGITGRTLTISSIALVRLAVWGRRHVSLPVLSGKGGELWARL